MTFIVQSIIIIMMEMFRRMFNGTQIKPREMILTASEVFKQNHIHRYANCYRVAIASTILLSSLTNTCLLESLILSIPDVIS
jgi:hypothetical protein